MKRARRWWIQYPPAYVKKYDMLFNGADSISTWDGTELTEKDVREWVRGLFDLKRCPAGFTCGPMGAV